MTVTGITIRFDEFVGKHPVRRHGKHWIDGGSQVVGIHPDTYIPFFINSTGSEVCRLCDGEKSVGTIISDLETLWPNVQSKRSHKGPLLLSSPPGGARPRGYNRVIF